MRFATRADEAALQRSGRLIPFSLITTSGLHPGEDVRVSRFASEIESARVGSQSIASISK